MVIMLVTMLLTGAAVGMVFPFFAKFFVIVIPGRELIFLISCLLAGLMLGLINYFIARMVLYNPIYRITDKVKEISEGNLTVKIGVGGRDIIGQLAVSIEVLAHNFSEIVSDARHAAYEVEMVSQSVRETTIAQAEGSQDAMKISNDQGENAQNQLESVQDINLVIETMKHDLNTAEDLVIKAVVSAGEFAGTATQGHQLIEQLNCRGIFVGKVLLMRFLSLLSIQI